MFLLVAENRIHSVCSNIVDLNQWGTLRTTDFPRSSFSGTGAEDCWCKLSADNNQRIVLSVISFQLFPRDPTCSEAGLYLQSERNRSKECTFLQQGHYYISSNKILYLNFYSKRPTTRGGFWIIYEGKNTTATAIFLGSELMNDHLLALSSSQQWTLSPKSCSNAATRTRCGRPITLAFPSLNTFSRRRHFRPPSPPRTQMEMVMTTQDHLSPPPKKCSHSRIITITIRQIAILKNWNYRSSRPSPRRCPVAARRKLSTVPTPPNLTATDTLKRSTCPNGSRTRP